MPLKIAVPLESAEGERRVSLDPAVVSRLRDRHQVEIAIQAGCGIGAGFYDDDYEDTQVVSEFADLVRDADIVLKVKPPSCEEAELLKRGSVMLSPMSAYLHLDVLAILQERNITTFAMDMLPRITRAQPMDMLSSQATVAGYKAALLAAELSPRMFPMMTTAAGTIRPSRVIVIGAGVAGLQAIATARRLGARVEAYDIRSAAREQIESLGARMIDTGVNAEGPRGFARGLNKEEKQQQHDVLADRMSQAHAVICAAAIPGRKAPSIVTTDMVEGMMPDTVIVDMAAETGGNCELTRSGESYWHGDTLVVGPLNLPSSGSVHATEMYARNLMNMLKLMLSDQGELQIDWHDEVLAGSVLTHAGGIHDQAVADLMGLELAEPVGSSVREKRSDEPDQSAGWLEEKNELALAEKAKLDEQSSESDTADTQTHSKTGTGSTSDGSDQSQVPDADKNTKAEIAAQAASEPAKSASSEMHVDSDPHSNTADTLESATAEDDELNEPRDDLMVIDGIGPALQSSLNAFGITQYVHLAQLDDAGVERLVEQLDGNTELNVAGWVQQAAELEAKK